MHTFTHEAKCIWVYPLLFPFPHCPCHLEFVILKNHMGNNGGVPRFGMHLNGMDDLTHKIFQVNLNTICFTWEAPTSIHSTRHTNAWRIILVWWHSRESMSLQTRHTCTLVHPWCLHKHVQRHCYPQNHACSITNVLQALDADTWVPRNHRLHTRSHITTHTSLTEPEATHTQPSHKMHPCRHSLTPRTTHSRESDVRPSNSPAGNVVSWL